MQNKRQSVIQFINNLAEQGAYDAIGDGISIQGRDFKVLYQNPVHKSFFGDHKGEHCYRAYRLRDKTCSNCPVEKVFRDGGIHRAKICALKQKKFDITASPLKGPTGNVLAGIEVVRDSTKSRRIKLALESQVKQQAAISGLGQRALADIDLNTLMEETVTAAASELDVEYTKILELLPDRNALKLTAGIGWKDGLVGHEIIDGEIRSQAGYTLMSSYPVIVEDLSREKRFNGPMLLIDHGVVSGMSVIIGDQYSPFGVLGAHTTRKRKFSRNDIHFLQSLSNILALTIERKQAEYELIHAKEEWEQTFDTIPDMITVIDNQQKIVKANRSMTDNLGVERKDLIGRTCYSTFHGTDKPPSYCRHKNIFLKGEKHIREIYEERLNRYFILSSSPIRDSSGRITGAVEVGHDITDRKILEKKIERSAVTDHLTGLLNRRGFFAVADQQRKLADRTNRIMSLLYLDLDGLKAINDKLGHNAGDRALIDTADILRQTFRESDVIARLGGDEFAVLLTGLLTKEMGNIVINHLQKNMSTSNEQPGRDYELKLSIGMTHYDPLHPSSISELMVEADALMYEDKNRRYKEAVVQMKKENGTEKRKFARHAVSGDRRAAIKGAGRIGIINISMGGIRLKSSGELIVDSHYRISIETRDNRKLAASGVIIWSSPAESEKESGSRASLYEAGFKFTNMTTVLKRSLEKFIDNLAVNPH